MKCFRFGRHKEGNAEARWGRTSGHCKVDQEHKKHIIHETGSVTSLHSHLACCSQLGDCDGSHMLIVSAFQCSVSAVSQRAVSLD